jgi:Tol biopolymer transport system component
MLLSILRAVRTTPQLRDRSVVVTAMGSRGRAQRLRQPIAAAATLTLTLTCLTASLALSAPTTERVSVDSAGMEQPGQSYPYKEAISANGRFVAFTSSAVLAPPDSSADNDVFLHDRSTGQTSEMTLTSTGADGRAAAHPERVAISADGCRVAFVSTGQLVPGDTDTIKDVYVRDRCAGTTVEASVRSDGANLGDRSRGPAISADGRLVAFYSGAHFVSGDEGRDFDIFIHNLATGKTSWVTRGAYVRPRMDQTTAFPAVSSNGHFVAFTSSQPFTRDDAANDVGNRKDQDVFVKNRRTGRITRVTRGDAIEALKADSGEEAIPAISGSGRLVAFVSRGHYTSGDVGHDTDVFVKDRRTGSVQRMSVRSNGTEANGDRLLTGSPSISADGRFVAFESKGRFTASDHDDHLDVFVHDRRTGKTRMVSTKANGSQSQAPAVGAAVSRTGRFIAFESPGQLTPGDAGSDSDVFVRGPLF